MARPDEISSTERLLSLIRTKGDHDTGVAPSPVAPSTKNAKKEKPPEWKQQANRGSRRKGLRIGVDIGEKDIKLVAVGLGLDRKPVLMNWAIMPMEPDIAKDGNNLTRFLKSALLGFGANRRKIELWGCISSANVETRAMRIPKVTAKQIPNAVLWAFRKEAAFDEKTDIFDYHVIGEILEENTPKLQVMASTAPKHEVDGLKQLFIKCGYPLSGISIVPFALQNLFRFGWLETNDKDVCALFIGRDWSRIAIFSKGNLVLSRDIKAGMKSLVQAVSEGIASLQDEISFQMLDMRDRAWEDTSDQRMQLDEDQSQQLLDNFINSADEATSSVLPEKDLFDMIRPALDRILRQVEMTFAHYNQHFSGQRVQRIYISGQISGQPLVSGYFNDQLGLEVEGVDPFVRSSLAEGVQAPGETQVRADFAPAAGLALSSMRLTPNFLYTYKDKSRKRTIRWFDSAVLVGFALIVLLLGGIYQFFDHQNSKKDKGVERLQSELDRFSPRLGQNLVLTLADQTVVQMKRLSVVSQRYMGLAVVNEIARITPAKVKLVSLTAEFDPPGGGAKKGKSRHVIVDGVVLGDRLTFDAVLAEYILKLGNSPMFQKPSIEKRTLENLDGKDVLRFAVRAKMI
ncbi:MAG: hypothetical protein JEZ11_05715 [Desulfobacterales bacterium]|nr:hypothetical protein [Desulfobacterales bacterium]